MNQGVWQWSFVAIVDVGLLVSLIYLMWLRKSRANDFGVLSLVLISVYQISAGMILLISLVTTLAAFGVLGLDNLLSFGGPGPRIINRITSISGLVAVLSGVAAIGLNSAPLRSGGGA